VPELNNTLAIILADGGSTELGPLTADRAKPAVPFGGKYRIIDFTLTNCLHSGIRRVLVMTQFKSYSLQKHLRDGWSILNPELREYITPVPPQMRSGEGSYAGTADAIFQNLYLLERSHDDTVLILAGDHIYRMDYAEMVRFHGSHQAPATLACMEVSGDEASDFDVVTVDGQDRVTGLATKREQSGPVPGQPDKRLVSMGIYIFDRSELIATLGANSQHAGSGCDLGQDVLARLLPEPGLYAYRFGGKAGRVSQDRYWRDVSTIDAYFDANMALLETVPPIDLYQEDWVIRTYQGQHPPGRTVPGESGHEGVFVNSILGGGVVISGGGVDHSVLFPRVRVGDEAIVQNSIVFEGVNVGPEARLRNCIVDKYVQIPAGTQIGLEPAQDRERFVISQNGIVVVPKGYTF